MNRILLLVLLIASHLWGTSQIKITAATLQASGLTCALCAKSIFTNLSSLSFVDNVDTDLNASSFLITFKKGQEINPGLLKKKVEDAGFFVSNLSFDFTASNQTINQEHPIKIGKSLFHVVNIKSKVLDGPSKWQIIDKGFVGAKELKKLMASIKQSCYQTSDIADCPDLEDITSFQTFHVIIK